MDQVWSEIPLSMKVYTFIAAWLILGLLGMLIGIMRGRGCAWLIFGIPLGPFALWVALFGGGFTRCKACKEEMRSGAKICPRCRTAT